jgi:hypothetical protein
MLTLTPISTTGTQGRRPGMGQARQTTTSTILHVTRGKVFLGEIIMDGRDRVRHADQRIPKDVVLKALVQYTHGDDLAGAIAGRDGKRYGWQLISWDGE